MKTNKLVLAILGTALIVSTGCNKDSAAQQDLDKAASDAGGALKNAAEAVKEGGEKVGQDVKQAGEALAKDVAKKAEEVAAPVNAKAQGIIDETKKLVSDGKLQEAVAKLKELTGEKLSAEQQALADGLKAQIDKLSGK
ncbi:MAG TPA: hypothetical protein VFZ59_04550 [Verrucomicrobiae bacterium]|nr:hypothetical protein [Verrucomicrobiae bacterium]